MAYISFKPTDYFNPLLYTGNASTNAITGVGFAPAISWFKSTSNTNSHAIFSTIMTTYSISPSNAAAQYNASGDGFTSLDSDGFTFNGSGGGGGTNASGFTYVSWNWKGGTTSGIATNGSTTITPSAYSFNTTSKFSIVKYTGNSTAGAKLAHGLGAVPKTVFVKSISDAGDAWAVYHVGTGNTDYGTLNTNAVFVDDATRWNDTDPDSVNFTLGSSGAVNSSSKTYVAYCFGDVNGSSRFSQYTGNGNVDGTFVYTGFKPALVILKSVTGSGDGWFMANNKSNPFNRVNKNLFVNTTGAESTNGTADGDKNLDFLAQGFKIRSTNSEVNAAGVNYVYMAWAEDPIIGSGGTVGVAR